MTQFNREDQFESLLEHEDLKSCKATGHKHDFIWKNYLQTESEINQSYEYNEEDKSIKLKDSYMKENARKAEELL